MARLKVNDYIDIGMKSNVIAVSWQVALDPNFMDIIDESLNDSINLHEWNTPLPKINEPGKYYSDLDKLYGRIKLFFTNGESAWYVMPIANQNAQEIRVTELDGSVTVYDSIIDNFN